MVTRVKISNFLHHISRRLSQKTKILLTKLVATFVIWRLNRWKTKAVHAQWRTFRKIIHQAKNTSFGIDHNFQAIKSYEDFKKRVPIRDYEQLRPYIDRVCRGEENVLWPGKPIYLAKTSGTTSGTKFIPITKDALPAHIKAARNALLSYVYETGNADIINGKMIFLQGSPVLDVQCGIAVGRLSGIVAHHVPLYLQKNRMPSYQANAIENWEDKIDAIVEETIQQDMRLISGIPPWVQMYFDRLQAKANGKKIKDIFKNFKLFVYGGVNYEPYRAQIEDAIGKRVDSIETYPASEGFIAYQDTQADKALLLQVNAGIFYEFIPLKTYTQQAPTRLSLEEVELGENYIIILNSNAGLWGYNLGDTVKFVCKNPYKLIVTGRTKQYLSAFGEHVIAEEVEYALSKASRQAYAHVTEFTVAPQVNPSVGNLPYHEWFIEFSKPPENLIELKNKLDQALQEQNIYYADLIKGRVLQPLLIRKLKQGAFKDYMKSKGKLGGQNKVPRLSNDRAIVQELECYIEDYEKT